MKRTIEFNFLDNEYFLQEEGNRIFTIKASDLKFNSIDFYNGVYKNKSANIISISLVIAKYSGELNSNQSSLFQIQYCFGEGDK